MIKGYGMAWLGDKLSCFDCNISALKFSDKEQQFLREIYFICKQRDALKTCFINTSLFAKRLCITPGRLKGIVRRCEQKGGLRVVASVPGRHGAARKYGLSENLYNVLRDHYKARRIAKRSLI